MGRWAEVYFTTTPEKREEAVLELVRELKREKSPSEGPGATHMTPSREPVSIVSNVPSSPVEERSSTLRRCASCGNQNPVVYKFCGACGKNLDNAVQERSGITDDRPAAKGGTDQARRADGERETRTAAMRLGGERRSQVFADSITNPHELSLFRSFRQTDSEYDSEPSTGRSRIYIGGVLVILSIAVAYMGWRVEHSSKSMRTTAPAADSAAKSTPATPTADVGTSQLANPTAPSPTQITRSTDAPVAKKATRERVSNSQPRTGPVEASRSQNVVDNGSEELTVAERYLNGTDGQRRDSAQAAKWLWKSVSKHNGQATLLLADLYLKGDGVFKSCDQARVLLDTAGRKGIPGAGVRLRNLPAFGCQ